MKINFYTRFQTKTGERVLVNVTIRYLTGTRVMEPMLMNYQYKTFWYASIETDDANAVKLQYSYTLINADGIHLDDGDLDREINLSEIETHEIRTIDTWNELGAYENIFYTSPFQNILLAENQVIIEVNPVKKFTHIFKVKAPLLQKNEVIFILGSSPALGDWNKNNAIFLAKEGAWWWIKVDIPAWNLPVDYKYGIYDTKEKEFIVYEGGENRRLHGDGSTDMFTILHDGFARFPYNKWKGAGVAIPVFSLKTGNSFGVGEFDDIKVLVDWAKRVGFKLIQILPVNDTSAMHCFTDAYPYTAISAFALHPVYINLEKIADKNHSTVVKQLTTKQKQLNDLPVPDYEQVMRFKLEVLEALCSAQKEICQKDGDFIAFFNSNSYWLEPYAAFCVLRHWNGTADFNLWKDYRVFDKNAIEKFVSPKAKQYDEIFLYYFIQYHLHLQLKEAAEYAHKNGIIVKGEIPIGICRQSCDAWVMPELFNLDMRAGAPPDEVSSKDRNWGYPPYNWQKMEEDGFAWWRRRFEQMGNYFDAIRIDHISGFFRIWSIPVHAVERVMGYFVPAVPLHDIENFIWYKHDRYTKPFINDQVLYDIFNDWVENVKQTYLDELTEGRYELKEDYNTQQKIEIYFNGLIQNDENKKIKTGLFDLISNVILLEAEGPQGPQFHFRINMEDTASFKNLHGYIQNELKGLYINYFQYQDDFWKKEALKKLPALKAVTNMFICGGDPGIVPHCVPQVMNELGILSLEIQRLSKGSNGEFSHSGNAPYFSVLTPATHDMSTITDWWVEDRAQTQRFFNHELGQQGEAPLFCDAWIFKVIILQHLHSPAMWSIFRLQDLLGMSDTIQRENPLEERINIPADPKHYGRYRMYLTLEDLLKANEFNDELKKHIEASDR